MDPFAALVVLKPRGHANHKPHAHSQFKKRCSTVTGPLAHIRQAFSMSMPLCLRLVGVVAKANEVTIDN